MVMFRKRAGVFYQVVAPRGFRPDETRAASFFERLQKRS